MGNSKDLARLERSAGEERQELAADLAEVRAQAASWKNRSAAWVAAVAGLVAAAAVAAAVVRRKRATRPISGTVRRASKRLRSEIQKYRPRPIPLTILLVLLRTPSVRRALASGAARMLQPERGRKDPREGDAEPRAPEARAEPSPRREEANREAPPAEEGEQKAKETLEALKHSPFKRKVRFVTDLFRDAFRAFLRDEALTRAAALAYYTILSLAPLLIVVIAVAGIAFGAEHVRNQILMQIGQLVGQDAAKTI
ncbi:MAG TPA: YhjD/YihY/BrkB family envelope integrity protein, partial [Thermoanaerobaculia bacterium]